MLTSKLASNVAFTRNRYLNLMKNGFATNNDADDDKLSRYNLFQRCIVSGKLGQPDGQLLFKKIKSEMKQVGGLSLKNARAWKTFTDLQHPLLAKYKFDRDGFLVGAKEAGSSFLRSLISQEVLSFSRNERKLAPEAVELLQSTSSPNLVNVIYGTILSLREQKLPVTITDICIKNAFMSGIDIDIYSDTKPILLNERVYHEKYISMSELIEFLAYPNEDNSDLADKVVESPYSGDNEEDSSLSDDEIARKENRLDQIKYPNGSVQANVKVVFTTEVTYNDNNLNNESNINVSNDIGNAVADIHLPTGENKEQNTMKTREENLEFTFSACISNQEELEWKVIHFESYHGDDVELTHMMLRSFLYVFMFSGIVLGFVE